MQEVSSSLLNFVEISDESVSLEIELSLRNADVDEALGSEKRHLPELYQTSTSSIVTWPCQIENKMIEVWARCFKEAP